MEGCADASAQPGGIRVIFSGVAAEFRAVFASFREKGSATATEPRRGDSDVREAVSDEVRALGEALVDVALMIETLMPLLTEHSGETDGPSRNALDLFDKVIDRVAWSIEALKPHPPAHDLVAIAEILLGATADYQEQLRRPARSPGPYPDDSAATSPQRVLQAVADLRLAFSKLSARP